MTVKGKCLLSPLAGVLLLAACYTNLNGRKLSYLNDGNRYFNSGKYQEAIIEFRNAIRIDRRFEEAHHQLAKAYLMLADISGARRELQTTVDLDPNNLEAKLQLANVLVAAHEYGEAQHLAGDVIAADPGNVQAYETLGASYIGTHDLPNAIRTFQTAIKIAPQRLNDYLSLAEIYISAGRPGEAEGIFRGAVNTLPKSSQAHLALGRFYFSEKKMADAEAELRIAIELDPKAVPPRFSLAPVYLATGRMAEAERICAELKTIAPKNPQAYRALSLFYLSTGQKGKALAELQAVSVSQPRDGVIKSLLIDTLMEAGRIDQAESLNRGVLKSSPTDSHALLVSGRLLIAQAKYRSALSELQKAVDAGPQSAVSFFYLGVAQSAVNLPDKAKSSWIRALELDPRMTDAQLALADFYARTGSYYDALRFADNALRTNPNLSSAYLIRANVLFAQGDTKNGEAALQAALDRDPTSLPALTLLFNLRTQERRYQDVLPRMLKLVERFPQNASFHFLLASTYFGLNNLNKAELAAKQTIVLSGQQPDAYTLLGRIHIAEGLDQQAKADLQSAIRANPREITNYMALGSLYEKESNWKEAQGLYERAYHLDPTSPQVLNDLAYLYLEHGGDINVALSLAQAARQRLPDSPHTADTVGWAYYKLGLPEPAVMQLRESVQKSPNNPTYQYHLGMAYMAAGHLDSAARSLQQALRDSPNFPDAVSARAALEEISKEQH